MTLVARYEAGATVYELAEAFGIHRHTVAQRLREAGVKLRRTAPTDDEITEMVQRYESGQSLARIAETIGGTTANTVKRCLLERGVAIRPRPGWSR
ncbi:sigma factor-like helix-turn-helix DNA-binding protein [Microbacterium sp. NPDC076895]|uniref:sigma factor-like helix-turn-helix DNA-binding protein n=1 Tax=Microbacterium sp. NPDC076895 TaxID=3154957 RepID=UPI0034420310